MRTRPIPSQIAGSSPSSSSAELALRLRAILVPSLVTAGRTRNAALAALAVFSRSALAAKTAWVASVGSSTTSPVAASTRASLPAMASAAPSRPTTIGTPRARANMATWLVGLPCVSRIAPPCAQSMARKREIGRSAATITEPSGMTGLAAPGSRWPSTRSRISSRSAVRAAEMIVPSVAVACDFDLHRGLPGGAGGRSRSNPFQRRADQFLVGQHRDLKAEHIGGLASRLSCQGLDFGQRSRQRPLKRQGLLGLSAGGLAPRPPGRIQDGHNAFRHSGRRTAAEQAKLSHVSDLPAHWSGRRIRRERGPSAHPPPPRRPGRMRARAKRRRAAPSPA